MRRRRLVGPWIPHSLNYMVAQSCHLALGIPEMEPAKHVYIEGTGSMLVATCIEVLVLSGSHDPGTL